MLTIDEIVYINDNDQAKASGKDYLNVKLMLPLSLCNQKMQSLLIVPGQLPLKKIS